MVCGSFCLGVWDRGGLVGRVDVRVGLFWCCDSCVTLVSFRGILLSPRSRIDWHCYVYDGMSDALCEMIPVYS